MANVLFKRGNTATINGTAIADGQLLYNTQTRTQYLDDGTTRLQIGQTVDATLNSSSNNPIANSGVAGVMVSSLNTIDSITNEGFITDALATKQLDMNLKANSNRFIFDYQGGKYGYNTDPNRGAGTFSPFNGALSIPSLKAWARATEGSMSGWAELIVDAKKFDSIKISSFAGNSPAPNPQLKILGSNDSSMSTYTTLLTQIGYTTSIPEKDISAYDYVEIYVNSGGSTANYNFYSVASNITLE